MTFIWPGLLWLLAALPVVVAAYVWLLRRRKKAVTGEVLARLDVYQRRGLDDQRTSQEHGEQNHRPLHHEVAANRLVLDHFWRQRLVFGQAFRRDSRRKGNVSRFGWSGVGHRDALY